MTHSSISTVGGICLADVAPTEILWLWPGRIPLGRVTLLVSDPGLGKSLLTLDIAARVSNGAPWPDEPNANLASRQGDKEIGRQGESLGDASSSSSLSPCLPLSLSNESPKTVTYSEESTPHYHHRPASVLFLTAEDDLAETIRPRLEALGADCSKIIAIPAVTIDPLAYAPTAIPGDLNLERAHRTFELRRDLGRLLNLLNHMPDCRLLVVDPISAFLGDTNEHSNSDLRALLAPLAALAHERGTAIVAVSHLRKKEGSAIHRTLGSLALVAAARAVWAVSKDPVDDTRRLFLPLKNNLAPDTAGLAFTIESYSPGVSPALKTTGVSPGLKTPGVAPVDLATGGSPVLCSGAPIIRWSPEPIAITAEAIVGRGDRSGGRPNDERRAAIEWLQTKLADGPRPATRIQGEAEANGFSKNTVRRAFRDLDGEAVRTGFGPLGQWLWKLPGIDAQNPGEEIWESMDFLDEFASAI